MKTWVGKALYWAGLPASAMRALPLSVWAMEHLHRPPRRLPRRDPGSLGSGTEGPRPAGVRRPPPLEAAEVAVLQSLGQAPGAPGAVLARSLRALSLHLVPPHPERHCPPLLAPAPSPPLGCR